MSDLIIRENLASLYDKSVPIEVANNHKFVIFSDLHLGNGGANDDFANNSRMFLRVLESFYLEHGFTLILNGDVEELQRFRLKDIERTWGDFYRLLDAFEVQTGLYKIVGNHDYELELRNLARYPYKIRESLRFEFGAHSVFVIHGHQASGYFGKWHPLTGYILRYLANPLRISNKGVPHDSRKQYKIERRIYDFSKERRIITIIGHTHRPLFESLSKIDDLRYKIESHLREYSGADAHDQARIRSEISEYKEKLSDLFALDAANSIESSLYNQLLVPTLFNSGCIIGKRGFTGIEIEDGRISLTHWFDGDRHRQYLEEDPSDISEIKSTGYYRKILKSDSLDYIFARINLLA